MRLSSFPCFFVLLALLSGCANNDGSAAETITEEPVPVAYQAAAAALEEGKEAAAVRQLLLDNFSSVSDPTTGGLKLAESQAYVRLALELSDKFPADTMVALPLYRAAEVARALNDPNRTTTIYQTVYQRYPTFSKAPEALFMLGFTYDEDLKDLTKARSIYTDFLAKYPDHTFADDTEMLLQNLGKSDEEILQELEKNAGQ